MKNSMPYVLIRVAIVFLLQLVPSFLSIHSTLGMGLLLGLCFLLALAEYQSGGRVRLGEGALTGILAAFLLLFGFLVLIFCLHPIAPDAVERLVQFVAVMFVFFSAANHEWQWQDVRFLVTALKAMCLLALALWPLSGFQMNYYAAFYAHSNQFGGCLLAASVLFTLRVGKQGRREWCFLALALFLLWISNSRSAIIGTLLVLGASLLLENRARLFTRRAMTVCFLALVLGGVAFTLLYVHVYGTPLGVSLEMLSRRYLKKNFFSGREYIWALTLQAIQRQPLWGHGLQASVEALFHVGLSGHNLYLQTALQSGVISVVLLLAVFYAVLVRVVRERSLHVRAVFCAFLLGIVAREFFEVSMTQNNIQSGMLLWFVLAQGCNASFCGLVEKNQRLNA